MLNKEDIALLKGAKEKGLSVDEIIITAEEMLVESELITDLINTTNEIYYKMRPIIHRDIKNFKNISDRKEVMKTIVLTAFDEFNAELLKREEETAKLLKEQEEQKIARDAEIKRIADEKLALETKTETDTVPDTVETTDI